MGEAVYGIAHFFKAARISVAPNQAEIGGLTLKGLGEILDEILVKQGGLPNTAALLERVGEPVTQGGVIAGKFLHLIKGSLGLLAPGVEPADGIGVGRGGTGDSLQPG